MLFLGTYQHTIDTKNRLNLPTKIVEKISNSSVFLSKGFEGCLELRTQDDFVKRCNEILNFSQNKKDSRILARQFLANSNEIEIDKVNRILIPNNLKVIANLSKNVTILGLGNKLEIWDSETYNKFKNETNDKFEEVAERINEINNDE